MGQPRPVRARPRRAQRNMGDWSISIILGSLPTPSNRLRLLDPSCFVGTNGDDLVPFPLGRGSSSRAQGASAGCRHGQLRFVVRAAASSFSTAAAAASRSANVLGSDGDASVAVFDLCSDPAESNPARDELFRRDAAGASPTEPTGGPMQARRGAKTGGGEATRLLFTLVASSSSFRKSACPRDGLDRGLRCCATGARFFAAAVGGGSWPGRAPATARRTGNRKCSVEWSIGTSESVTSTAGRARG